MKKIKLLTGLMTMALMLVPSMQVGATELVTETTPPVTISSYSIASGTLSQGEQVTLNLDFSNLSTRTDVKEVLVSYTSPNEAASPIFGNSNQIYISNIDRQQTQEVQLTVNIADTATTDIQLAFTIEYASSSNEEYSNEAYIDIPMEVQSQLSVNSLYVAASANVGVNSLVSISYGNTGEDEIDNVMMSIQGDIPEEQKQVSLGDLQAGQVNSKDNYVTFQTAGSQILEITCSYEDKNGNVVTLDPKDYTVQVTEVGSDIMNDTTTATKDATDVEVTSSGISISTALIAIAVATVIILIAAAILRVIRRRKRS